MVIPHLFLPESERTKAVTRCFTLASDMVFDWLAIAAMVYGNDCNRIVRICQKVL